MKDRKELVCQDNACGKRFLAIAQELTFYRKKNLPDPIHCPACRHRQRMALRNERQLYKRTCDCCGSEMFSTYPPSAPYKIYCQECFWENIG